MKIKEKTINSLFIIGFGIASIFFVVALIFWTLVPYLQMMAYRGIVSSEKAEKLLSNDFIFSPYSYAQLEIRPHFLGLMIDQPQPESEIYIKLFDRAILKNEELIEKEPYHAIYFSLLAEAYDKKAEFEDNLEFYRKAEEFYKKALSLVPRRQEINYAYALNLAYQERTNEAILVLEKVLKDNEDIPDSHFYLGLVLAMAGEGHYPEALEYLETALDNPRFRTSVPRSNKTKKQLYERFFKYFYEIQDKENLTTTLVRLKTLGSTQAYNYQKVLDFINQTGQIPIIEFE